MDLTDQQPLVLLAEADAMIGADMSDALEQAGYRVLGPFGTTPEALAGLERERPTLAVVDVKLRDGFCTALGDALRQRGVPVVVHSGFQSGEPRAVGFHGSPWLTKPALPEDVVALLDELSLSRTAPVSIEALPSLQSAQAAESRGNPLVRKLEGFVSLSEADKALLERISASSRVVPSQTNLVREGEAPKGVFLILEGMACRHKVRANGTRQIMAYLVPGDLCDLDVALLDTMDHSITALSTSKVVCIPPKVIAKVMENHPQLARALRMSTLVDEATLREWLVNVGCRSARERVAHLFCELQVRMRAVSLADGDSYDMPVTQAALADTTGMSVVHLNRTLQELRREGLIELQQRRMTILDLPRLRALAEFKPNYLHLGERAAA
ncbi:helix-turn-helix domain-containing protein [Methylobacterium sp. J-059]|uniref:helix-turn-helix domain-containing protein n=1 Tax=Methylobacterium sp. J-059 TaxID=2836643 RepID=UPI001FBA11AD|nr:helix-turn-helix domain-containing protein [Methylobacterium sp. J-059]MCJ2042540.1 helix-turn-helix domain-containing protein [Methylobacterium sp. J-059]